jgi:hypothetical protein
MDIIKNAKTATNVWNKLDSDKQKKLKKHFHLRPTNSGITIVSTLPFLPMRGINVKSKKNLGIKLNELYNDYEIIVGVDENKAENHLISTYQFKQRNKTKYNIGSIEEDMQTLIINSMINNELNLSITLNKKIMFITSELIIVKGKHRVDIVGFDGEDLYFFEIKKDRTTKVEQVSDYVSHYKSIRYKLEDLLKNYPINPISKFIDIKGVVVMRYSENSVKQYDWKALEKQHNIKILFYKPSISFINP